MKDSSPRYAFSMLREFSIPLIVGVVAAMVWANLSPKTYVAVVHTRFIGHVSLEFLANELFMAVFFGIAAVEITDNLLPGGSLNPPRKAVTPLFATAGGVLGPVVLYFFLNAVVGRPELSRGWGIGTATDIALAWLVARLIFGGSHPAISFLLLLAIADDAIGLVIIAVFYPDPNHPVFLPALGLVAAGMVAALILRWCRIRNYWPYVLIGGTLSWTGLFLAHLHPALALVFVVPFMPHTRQPVQSTVFDVLEDDRSTLATFEHEWKVIVDFGLLFFGLANAGVQFSAVGTITWLVLLSLILGKTAGIYGLAMISRRLGFALPTGMSGWDLLLVSMISGIGLTVALFMASVAFADPQIEAAAKMGALSSVAIVPLVLLFKLFGVSRASERELTYTA
jgi:NhaA family Na+:H+ antiporter